MSAGFRKSMFGFNCNDVMQYISELHRKFSSKESELSAQLAQQKKEKDELDAQLEAMKDKISTLEAQKQSAEEELSRFTEKYDEVERLSQNIGRLYMVAQSNARSVAAGSAENLELSRREVKGNLDAIDEAHTSLEETRARVVQTSQDFVSSIDALIASLSDTRSRLASNESDCNEKIAELEAMCSQLIK